MKKYLLIAFAVLLMACEKEQVTIEQKEEPKKEDVIKWHSITYQLSNISTVYQVTMKETDIKIVTGNIRPCILIVKEGGLVVKDSIDIKEAKTIYYYNGKLSIK